MRGTPSYQVLVYNVRFMFVISTNDIKMNFF